MNTGKDTFMALLGWLLPIGFLAMCVMQHAAVQAVEMGTMTFTSQITAPKPVPVPLDKSCRVMIVDAGSSGTSNHSKLNLGELITSIFPNAQAATSHRGVATDSVPKHNLACDEEKKEK